MRVHINDENCTASIESSTVAGLRLGLSSLARLIDEAEATARKVADDAAALEVNDFPQEKKTPEDYGIDDYVKLSPRFGGVEEARLLDKYGRWWKCRAATRGSLGSGTAWILKSLTGQPRENKNVVHEFVMQKRGDPRFAVVGVGKFPDPFNYKLFEARLKCQT